MDFGNEFKIKINNVVAIECAESFRLWSERSGSVRLIRPWYGMVWYGIPYGRGVSHWFLIRSIELN